MNAITMSSEVSAPVKTVWEVLSEPAYIAKLFPDVLTVEVEPPGRAVEGQAFRITGKAGRRRVEIFGVRTEVIHERKMVTRQRTGGVFETFESTVLLEPKGDATEVTTTFQYELSLGYLGKMFNLVLIERLVGDNLKAYIHNLKDICELLPIA